jgi:hypothetical protein
MAEDQTYEDDDDRVSVMGGKSRSYRFPGFYGGQESQTTSNVIQGSPQSNPQDIVSEVKTGAGDTDSINTGAGDSGDSGGGIQNSDSSGLNSIYAETPPPMPEMPSLGDAAKGLGESLAMTAVGGAGSEVGRTIYSGTGDVLTAGLGGAQDALSTVTGGAIPAASSISAAGASQGSSLVYDAQDFGDSITGTTANTAEATAASASSLSGIEGGADYLSQGSTYSSAAGAGVGSGIIDYAITGDAESAVKKGVSVAAGEIVGGGIGFAVGGPGGAAVGRFIGRLVGAVFGTVICTELVAQNRITKRCQTINHMYNKYLPDCGLRGYHFWAVPTVRLMRRSVFVSYIMEKLFTWRAEEIIHRLKMRKRGGWSRRLAWVNGGNIKGKLFRIVMEPISILIGLLIPEQNYGVLYSNREVIV